MTCPIKLLELPGGTNKWEVGVVYLLDQYQRKYKSTLKNRSYLMKDPIRINDLGHRP